LCTFSVKKSLCSSNEVGAKNLYCITGNGQRGDEQSVGAIRVAERLARDRTAGIADLAEGIIVDNAGGDNGEKPMVLKRKLLAGLAPASTTPVTDSAGMR
jgi:hypothetical protein